MTQEWHRAHRQPCRGGCGRLVWITTARHRTGYCPTCFGAAQARTVRDDMLLCTRCGQWKPDDAFPLRRDQKARRGRHADCRDCQTERKREQRARLTDQERERVRAYDRERHRRKAAA